MAKDQLQFAEGVTGEGITALSKMNEGASTGDAANFDFASANDVLTSSQIQPQPSFQVAPQDTNISTPKADQFQNEVKTDTEVAKTREDKLAQQVEKDKADFAGKETSTFEDMVSNIINSPGFGEIQQEQYKKAGVDEKQLRVDELSTKLLAEQDSLRKAKEDIMTKGGGLKMGAQAEMANLERDSLRRQSDLAILQLAAQDQLDYATRVADRAVNAMFDRQEKINAALKMVYERNKSLFTTAEQRSFELALSDRNRALDDEKEAEALLKSTQIDALKMAQLNNAPQQVIDAIMSSESPMEVLDVAGQYGSVDMLARQQIRSNMALKGLDRKIKLLQLASEGDESAIEELGYDPRDLSLSSDEIRANADAYRKNQKDINRINEMFANDRGLQAVSGAVRNPLLTGFFSGGERGKDVSIPNRIVGGLPVVGNIVGSAQSRDAAA